jgi:hypothetical protein
MQPLCSMQSENGCCPQRSLEKQKDNDDPSKTTRTKNGNHQTTKTRKDASHQKSPCCESLPYASYSLAQNYDCEKKQSHNARTQESSSCPQNEDRHR